MRVIAGSMKGHPLKVPRSTRTRPMSQRIREAVYSTLASLGVRPERVVDLYAGSGGIGIEALSRGAEWCDFVEQNAAACAVIRDNLAGTRFGERAAVHQASVESFLARATEAYDLVLMDPPYADPRIVETLAALAGSAAVGEGTVVVLGHWPRLDTPERVGTLHRLRHRCHGDSCFSIYEADETVPAGRGAVQEG
ncbi:MAG TPA: RsmD family RNA methyltransferase [Thermomicrobiaceae bacterium]|nr:RsmD family RNA methyltransferase [Thermomicrobiaceae bacterium]